MFSRNSLKLMMLVVVACSTCGCDFSLQDLLHRRGGHGHDNDGGADNSGNQVIINIFTGQSNSPPGAAVIPVNQGSYRIPPTQSFLPGDLNFRGPNYTSFLPPTAPSAVGNPF